MRTALSRSKPVSAVPQVETAQDGDVYELNFAAVEVLAAIDRPLRAALGQVDERKSKALDGASRGAG